MTTERLQEFVILAQALNYSKAAATLFITQSSLSKHIKEMEKELSTTLFIRNTHGVALTDEGLLLSRQLPALLKEAELAETLLKTEKCLGSGTVKIKYHEQCMCSPIISFLTRFKDQHNDIDLYLQVVYSAPGINVIGNADILISPCDFTARTSTDYYSAKIYSQKALLAIPPHHHLGERQSISLSEIGGENLMVPYAEELFGPYSRNYFLAARKSKEKIQKISVSSAEDGYLKVALGEGLMIIPHHLKNCLYPRTRTLNIQDEECFFPVYLYAKKSSSESATELFYRSMLSL